MGNFNNGVITVSVSETNQRKPKESIDLNSSEGLNINFKDLIQFVD